MTHHKTINDMKQLSRILFRLSLLAALMMDSSLPLCAVEYYNIIHDNQHSIEINGIHYYLHYSGGKANTVVEYASVTGVAKKAEVRGYSIEGTLNLQMEWEEKDPNSGKYVKKYKPLNFPVTNIGPDAFKKSKATSITIPNSVKTIGGSAFEKCVNLQSITIPDQVTYLGAAALKECTSLKDAKIGNSIKVLEASMFEGCTSLKTLVIGHSVEEFGGNILQYIDIEKCTSETGNCGDDCHYHACTDCTVDCHRVNLKAIICNATTPPKIDNYTFWSNPKYYKQVTLYVPEQSISAYQDHKYWGKFENIQSNKFMKNDQKTQDTVGDSEHKSKRF